MDDFNPQTGKTTMQLVRTPAHEATFPHAGSVSQFEKHFNLPSNSYGSQEDVVISYYNGWLKGRVFKTAKTLKVGCN